MSLSMMSTPSRPKIKNSHTECTCASNPIYTGGNLIVCQLLQPAIIHDCRYTAGLIITGSNVHDMPALQI